MEHELIDGIQRPKIRVKDWGTDKIDLRKSNVTIVTHITEIHHKSDGALDNGASLGLMSEGMGETVLSQITLYSLGKALSQLGYQIAPVDPKT